jgi:acyl-CoA thioesterase-2
LTRNALMPPQPVRSRAVQPDDPATADLVSMLSLTREDADLFRGICHAGAPLRAFGGQVAAQALTAAGHTLDAARSPNSLFTMSASSSDRRRDMTGTSGCPPPYRPSS